MTDTEGFLVIKLENGLPVEYPVTYTNLKQLYPSIVFSTIPTKDQVDPLGYGLFYISYPEQVPQTHSEQDGYSYNEQNSSWTYKWKYTPYTQEEIVAEEQANLDKKWAQFRANRNAKLSMSDFTQLADAPFTQEKKAEWAVYRQSLRDLPNTVDINNIVWPLAPM